MESPLETWSHEIPPPQVRPVRRPRPFRGCRSAAFRPGRRPHRRGVRETPLPLHRTGDHVGPHLGLRRVRGESGDLLRRHRAWRRLEDHQQRRAVHAAAPGQGAALDRRRRRPAEQSERRLGRHGRGEQSPDVIVGRGTLQVHGRRQDLHARRPARLEAYRAHRDRSAQSGHRLRRGGRSAVRARRRTRRLQDDGRRQDLAQRAQGRPGHRRQRPADVDYRSRSDVRVDVPAPPHAPAA